ncbi:DUF1573 domain-containing protein [Flavobacterium sp.]|uniref:DUF1573 domain-containing protein n=1 Tax=Flavobacterium sp. TaxID=239 RepID=UPI00375183BE
MKIVKISLLALTISLMSFSVISNEVKSEISSTIVSAISWKSDSVDVGQIPQGTPKNIEFEFKNTGDKPVIITNVKPACGCTAADYTKDQIAPGKSGFIKAIYNAAAPGAFSKTVTVTTSADETPKVLTFKGTVVAKA